MRFDEVLDQVRELLRQRGRLSYGALKRRFDLDEEYLEDIKGELIEAEQVASDENGRILVWTGGESSPTPPSAPAAPSTTAAASTPPRSDKHKAPSSERRQLTVMFCDLVGSTALSERLDPEELHQTVRAYQQACDQVIERHEGHIAQYLGDGLLVYFGYPTAHEDDAIRAVRTGLEILDQLQTLRLAHPLQVRVGIHTGHVVVGEIGTGGRKEQLALGETPNIAARVQSKAEPNTVVISANTYHLVQGFFACEDLGSQELKGLSSPLTLYRVQGAGAAQSRFDIAVQRGLTPLVGREEELELLHRRWERAKAGEGQVVLLNGEAGIGKSRLVQVLRERIADQPQLSIILRCSPFYQNSALYPVIDRLQRFLQLGRDETPEEKLSKLTQAFEPVRMTNQETVGLFASLLAIPLPEDHPPLQLTPQKQKEKTLQALISWLQKAAEQQPVRLEIEDLHWADPSTLELLGLLIDQAATFPILILLTFRPEFTPSWPTQAHVLPIQLSRLPQKHIAAIVQGVAGKRLPEEVLRQLITKSDGIPLYIEEMTKNLLESGLLKETDGYFEVTGPLPQLAIPTTLQDSFASRLDRFASVRELAQVGAVLGREFSYELIRAVSQLEDPPLQDGLRQLGAAEIFFQRGLPPDATYTFKHALLQDAAYASLLRSKRQQLHAQTAQVLEQQFAETVQMHPELVAHHYTKAGLSEQAIPYWQQAGQRAIERSANEEAIRHLTTGLELLATLPTTSGRLQMELTLLTMLGVSFMNTKGWAAPEVKQAFTRAHELSQQTEETPQLFPVLFGLAAYHGNRAENRTARELAERCLRLADHVQDVGLLLVAECFLGGILAHMGEFVQAREYCEHGLTLYDPTQHRALGFRFGLDPGVTCGFYAALTSWYLGYPDQALTWAQDTWAMAQDLSHPLSRTVGFMALPSVHLLRREASLAQERAEMAMTLSTEMEEVIGLLFFTMLKGAALAEQGQGEEGLSLLQQGWTALQAKGMRIYSTPFLLMQAHTYGRLGRAKEGLAVLADMTAFIEETDEHMGEAELHRLKGELTLQAHGQTPTVKVQHEAEVLFQKAIEIAQKQHAKSLELRAATSLARLWQQQGKKEEAHQLLSEIYSWFTEGFDTRDLQDAKALLEELV